MTEKTQIHIPSCLLVFIHKQPVSTTAQQQKMHLFHAGINVFHSIFKSSLRKESNIFFSIKQFPVLKILPHELDGKSINPEAT